jgi:nucleotide-binding universal stress UspA family protein
MYPFLSLKSISIDAGLVKRLPRALAYYHLAVPIAEDEDSITVAMALTDNRQVIELLQNVLNTSISPVRSPADEIKRALDSVWEQASHDDHQKLLAWSAAPHDLEKVRAYADTFSQSLRLEVIYAESPVLKTLRGDEYQLLVTTEPKNIDLLLTEAPSPVLLVRGASRLFQRVLFVLRGHAPDLVALDYVLPLIHEQNLQVTLLSVAPSSIAELLSHESTSGKHLYACIEVLTTASVRGELKLRQGKPETEITLEIANSDYDLVVIAAETYGSFVHQILIGLRSYINTSPILVIKSASTPESPVVEG